MRYLEVKLYPLGQRLPKNAYAFSKNEKLHAKRICKEYNENLERWDRVKHTHANYSVTGPEGWWVIVENESPTEWGKYSL